MRPIALVLALAASLNAPAAFAAAPDSRALDRARRAYNAGRYDAAIGAARHALEVPDQADAARLVMAPGLLPGVRTPPLAGDLVEARRDPSSAAAAYWVAAAARGLGQLDRAWQAAMAAWVRTGLTQDRAAALRADLDRLVVTAIIPGRPPQPRPARGGRGEGG